MCNRSLGEVPDWSAAGSGRGSCDEGGFGSGGIFAPMQSFEEGGVFRRVLLGGCVRLCIMNWSFWLCGLWFAGARARCGRLPSRGTIWTRDMIYRVVKGGLFKGSRSITVEVRFISFIAAASVLYVYRQS
jgi:hypothetical protein